MSESPEVLSAAGLAIAGQAASSQQSFGGAPAQSTSALFSGGAGVSTAPPTFASAASTPFTGSDSTTTRTDSRPLDGDRPTNYRL